MDKRKLIQIVEKELDELKLITEEISENEKDSGLIIEIALGKARVLCNEIELLRTLSNFEEPDVENKLNEIDQASDLNISDPELEITTTTDDDDDISFSTEEFEETTDEEDDEEDDLTDEEDDLIDDEEDDLDEDDTLEEEDDELLDFEKDRNLHNSNDEKDKRTEEVKSIKTGFRELTLDDPDDEPMPVISPAQAKIPERPVFKEIPKPEEPISGKKNDNESFPKNPSLNDSIGENKQLESKITTGPVNSLKAAIGLNDRYQFVREIFANNSDKYNQVIDHLDKLETIQQAVEYLKSQLTLQKTETSMKFVELLKRRFTK